MSAARNLPARRRSPGGDGLARGRGALLGARARVDRIEPPLDGGFIALRFAIARALQSSATAVAVGASASGSEAASGSDPVDRSDSGTGA